MTNTEFSNEFDILYNNIANNQAPGLTEYEKSVFLTNAQDALVLELYSGKNALGDSFEKTEEVRQYLSNIVKTTKAGSYTGKDIVPISNKSHLYEKPEDMWFPIYEYVTFSDNNLTCIPSTSIEVVPITHDEFSRINKNPFRKNNTNRVLRLDTQDKIELVSSYSIGDYVIRYIKLLPPIILYPLDEGLTIKKESTNTECFLHPALHRAILERAVYMAKSSMGLVGQVNQNNN